MLESHKHAHPQRLFDGIVDNRVQQIPKGMALLFYGLILWGALYCGYYLLGGWSSQAQLEADMKAHQAAAAPSAGAQR